MDEAYLRSLMAGGPSEPLSSPAPSITGESGRNRATALSDEKGKADNNVNGTVRDISGADDIGCSDFRDNVNRLISAAVVIGVSPDSIKSHKKFKENHDLNFILLSDTEHQLAEQFGVWKEKSMYGRKYMGIERSTFVLDKDGNIEKEWRNVKVKGHVDEVLAYLTGNNP